jgi:hypothetical protein
MTDVTNHRRRLQVMTFATARRPWPAGRLSAMTLTIWGYEARLTGWQALATPLGAGVLGAVTTAMAYASHASAPSVDRDLIGVVEVALPLAGALAAIWSVLGDRALEVQLSLPRRYRNLVLGRLGLALAPTALLGCATSAALAMAGRLHHDVFSAQLVWLSPALALTGLGLAVAVAARSAAAGTAVIAVAWLLEQVKRDAFAEHAWARPLFLFTTTYQPDQPAWLGDRFALLALAAAALTTAWLLLARPERLLKEDL